MRNTYRIVVGKLEIKRPPERLGEDDIKMDVREIECEMWTELKWPRIGSNGKILGTW
jgi:hypothetical protein